MAKRRLESVVTMSESARFFEGKSALHATLTRLWRNKYLTLDAKSLDDMIATMAAAASELRQMHADGVVLDPDGGTANDYATLVTTDPEIARKYEMHDENPVAPRGLGHA